MTGSRTLTIAFVLATLGVPAPAMLSGNTALELCESDHPTDVAYCEGFVMGAVSLGRVISERQGELLDGLGLTEACIPEGVTLDQIIDVYIAYLQSRPEIRHYEASTYVWISVLGAFPCE